MKSKRTKILLASLLSLGLTLSHSTASAVTLSIRVNQQEQFGSGLNERETKLDAKSANLFLTNLSKSDPAQFKKIEVTLGILNGLLAAFKECLSGNNNSNSECKDPLSLFNEINQGTLKETTALAAAVLPPFTIPFEIPISLCEPLDVTLAECLDLTPTHFFYEPVWGPGLYPAAEGACVELGEGVIICGEGIGEGVAIGGGEAACGAGAAGAGAAVIGGFGVGYLLYRGTGIGTGTSFFDMCHDDLSGCGALLHPIETFRGICHWIMN